VSAHDGDAAGHSDSGSVLPRAVDTDDFVSRAMPGASASGAGPGAGSAAQSRVMGRKRLRQAPARFDDGDADGAQKYAGQLVRHSRAAKRKRLDIIEPGGGGGSHGAAAAGGAGVEQGKARSGTAKATREANWAELHRLSRAARDAAFWDYGRFLIYLHQRAHAPSIEPMRARSIVSRQSAMAAVGGGADSAASSAGSVAQVSVALDA
jgi:hypothetical protein